MNNTPTIKNVSALSMDLWFSLCFLVIGTKNI
jgi:hypothetical protein